MSTSMNNLQANPFGRPFRTCFSDYERRLAIKGAGFTCGALVLLAGGYVFTDMNVRMLGLLVIAILLMPAVGFLFQLPLWRLNQADRRKIDLASARYRLNDPEIRALWKQLDPSNITIYPSEDGEEYVGFHAVRYHRVNRENFIFDAGERASIFSNRMYASLGALIAGH